MMYLKALKATQSIVLLGLLAATGSASAASWVSQSKMNVGRVEATTIDYRDDLYVFNGFKPGIRIANSVEKYDAGTKKWSIIGTTSTVLGNAVTHNGAVRIGADVWIIGGRIGSHPGKVSEKVWIFNLSSQKWRRGPDMPTGVAAGGAALVNNKVHWFGGLDTKARCDVDNHYVYDLDKPASGWKNITSSAAMPSPRNHFSTAVVDGIIYAMGGQFGHDSCPTARTQDTPLVHAFNPATNKWTQKANLPNKNSHSEPGTFVYKNDIYTTGGENAKNKVWKYSPRTNKWSTFKLLAEDLIAPVARIIDGRLIVAGGGAPDARQSTDRVRSMLVDNNPPNGEPEPDPDPQPDPQPEPEPEPEPPQPVPGSHTPAGASLISMEAEYFDINTSTSTHQWIHVARGGSSNDDAMITTPDEGQLAATTGSTPMLSYMVFFNHTGKHYIWVRGSGDTNSNGVGSNDSIHIGLNGTVADTAYRIDTFPSEWTWSRHTPSDPVASLNITDAGVNVVNIWMREDGLAIDKFVITSDPDFVPMGFGPEVTDGTDDYAEPVTEEPVTEEPVTEEPVVEEPVTEEPSVVVPAENDPLASDPMNDDPATEPNDAVDPIQSNDEVDTVDPVPTPNRSTNGLFGGSASIFGLIALFGLVLLRVARAKPIRIV